MTDNTGAEIIWSVIETTDNISVLKPFTNIETAKKYFETIINQWSYTNKAVIFFNYWIYLSEDESVIITLCRQGE